MPIALGNPYAGPGAEIAAQHIAIGAPSDFEQNWQASWDSSRVNDRFVGEQTSIEDAYQDYADKVFSSRGIRLPNPARHELPDNVTRMDLTGDPRIPVPTELAAKEFETYARKMGLEPPSFADVVKIVRTKRYGAEQARNEVSGRADSFGAEAGSFLGSAAAIASDPPVLASMLFGGGGASTVLRAMGREALVAGGTEALLQPSVQSARVKAGLPGGVVQGAENVALAAGGAAGLTGLLRGASAAYRGMRGQLDKWAPLTAAESEARNYTARYADLQADNPLIETPAGAAEHVDRVSAAQTKLYDPEPDLAATRISDAPSAPVRDLAELSAPTRRAVADNAEAIKLARTLGEEFSEIAKRSEAGLDMFKRAQATAQEIGPVLDDAGIDLARGSAPKAPSDDPSLVQFIINRGGINDADRSLASIGVTPRQRPGLVSKTGLSASDMSELAAEAGYFPPAGIGEGSRAVDQRELATAIAEEIQSGQKLYARHSNFGNAAARADFETNSQIHADLRRAFSELGLDPRRLTNQEIRDAVQSVAEAKSPVPEQRMDWSHEAIERAVRSAEELDAFVDMEERLAVMAERNMRSDFETRMDEAFFIEVDGEVRQVTAREVFDGLDEDAKLVNQFANCIGEAPF